MEEKLNAVHACSVSALSNSFLTNCQFLFCLATHFCSATTRPPLARTPMVDIRNSGYEIYLTFLSCFGMDRCFVLLCDDAKKPVKYKKILKRIYIKI